MGLPSCDRAGCERSLNVYCDAEDQSRRTIYALGIFKTLGIFKMASHPKVGLLNSWKEIATYLGRGVRTVQRWEKFGLPVRRLAPGSRVAVMASTRDIDRWFESARTHGFKAPQNADHLLFRGALLDSIEQLRSLRQEAATLREDQRHAMAELLANIAALEKSCSIRNRSIVHPTPHPDRDYHHQRLTSLT
jgi:hypothetical protein